MEKLTWEEAKQKVAESALCIPLCDDCLTKAAELWQQSNLERINNYQEKLNEQLRRIHGQEGRIQGQATKIIKQDLRIKELEEELKAETEHSLSLLQHGNDLQMILNKRDSRIKELEDGLKELAFMAETSGGTAGRDENLCKAIDNAKQLLK